MREAENEADYAYATIGKKADYKRLDRK